MRALILACLFAMLLGGCSGGALSVNCPEFASLRHDLPPSTLQREIQRQASADALAASQAGSAASDLDRRIHRLVRPALQRARPDAMLTTAAPGEAVLLLSGGGQWGAFGAGFLEAMHASGRLPEFVLITGVSTGALQSLFVAVDTPEAWDALIAAYSPAREQDVVNRRPEWQALFRGSIAGLRPLEQRIAEALCPDAVIDDPARPCMLDAIRALDGRKSVLLGFVNAASGKFQYVDAVEVAQLPRRRARACLTGAALASAAMPVFFEPVQIEGETYFDGGVRASVFEASVAASAKAALEIEESLNPGRPIPSEEARLPIYVVRNGPTTVEADPGIDTSGGALSAALRAEAIVVNELEVGSIAAIRLEHPSGPLRLVTADGWSSPGRACEKPPSVMFDPEFMQCLRRFGRARAASARDPWIHLSSIATAPQ
ncbi:patatin-like phospholipase family protein [Sphingosinithalassobacter sp. CS137]|uniref:patatin-like phospholipase family protein n=1 Tax=Sphingosinithalassobacter sp. CS137 TaxID=2762748 RepID=UPI00165E96B5|nr:patatin-like phospholipase family protein [Sphingosinithalassobacter sp. CS137]